ncbi:MAG TPA: hypothetical protein GXZ60_04680, partial [Intrasporangiaceae bacterium]|nr:hypothetical protein [Intrasporangiaceae bacterium]
MAQSSEMTASGSGVLDLIQGVVDACSVPAGERGVDGWMDLIAEVTAGMSALAAARDAAIVRLAALDEVVTEDGVIGVQVNGLGSVCVDAGAMVSTATGTSARFGEELVKQAVTRVVRVPAVQQAMTEGVLDDYKARCIAGELTDVPVELARTVVDVLAPEMRERSGPALRRRTRDILFRLAPELLKERLREARNAVSVRRWLGEPGTDNWSAVFPSERSARAWAAVDALAHRYREDGAYPTLEQARAYALLDLVDGNATVETVLDLTVAADALAEAIERQGADESVADARPTRPSAQALSDAPSPRPPVRRGSDRDPGRDASPGRGVDAPERHVSAPERGGGAPERHVSKAERCETSRTREQDALEPIFITVSGARGSEVRWMPLDALPAVPLTAPGRARVAGPTPSWARSRVGDPGPAVRFVHPVSGALVDLDHELSTDAYRPNVRLKSFIRQRDGRCRFPGCIIAARWCDIDHVIPWPHGPTAADNLMCL